jgi:hypothetical protein
VHAASGSSAAYAAGWRKVSMRWQTASMPQFDDVQLEQ